MSFVSGRRLKLSLLVEAGGSGGSGVGCSLFGAKGFDGWDDVVLDC